MPKFPERLDLDLADAFARDVEVLSDFLQRAFAAIGVQTETQTDHFLLAWAEGLQDIAGDVARVRMDHAFGRTDSGLILDEITHLRFTRLANGSFQRDRLLNQVQRFAHLVRGGVHAFGDFFSRWFAAHFNDQLTRYLFDLIDHFDHVDRNADGPRLVGDCSGDRLANPPGCVGRKLVTTAPVKFLDALHQTEVSFLNQIEELQTAVLVLLGNRDDQAQVSLGQLMFRPSRLGFAVSNHLPRSLDLHRRDVALCFGLLETPFCRRDLPFQLVSFLRLKARRVQSVTSLFDFTLGHTHFLVHRFNGID